MNKRWPLAGVAKQQQATLRKYTWVVLLVAALNGCGDDETDGADGGSDVTADGADTADRADTDDGDASADTAGTNDAETDLADSEDRGGDDSDDDDPNDDMSDPTDASDSDDDVSDSGDDASDSGDDASDANQVDSDLGDSTDVGVDVPPPPVGIETRPSNDTCVAPPRPQGAYPVTFTRVFRSLVLGTTIEMLQPPGNNDVWYFVHKAGTITRIANDPDTDATDPELFGDISGRAYSGFYESGLLSMAFHPDFPNTREVYLHYNYSENAGSTLFTRLSRFDLEADAIVLDESSEEILIEFEQDFSNHNGGSVEFGPDGYLYMALGDGGDANDRLNRAQDLDQLFGKILRIDIDLDTGYDIPGDNPFEDGGGRAEIFAWGMRNPWRISFDSLTGDLWAGDVGQGRFEEVDIIEIGNNYGWPTFEADRCNTDHVGVNAGVCDASRDDMTFPVTSYSHSFGISITGGRVYRGSEIEDLYGDYLYGDFGSGRVWAYGENPISGEFESVEVANTSISLAHFAEDQDGEIWAVDLGGSIWRMEAPLEPQDFPDLLSETGCVAFDDPTAVASGLIPYDIQVAFWSDGAVKERYLALPNGTEIHIEDDGDWSFPIGTVLMKLFWLDGVRIETRLLVRHQDGEWGGYTYLWNVEQTEATVTFEAVEQNIDGQDWYFPAPGDCTRCHTTAALRALGPRTEQMNRSLLYPSGVTANQLDTFHHIGLFDDDLPGAVDTLQRLPETDDTDITLSDRVSAYLDSNCSHCHRPGGGGGGTFDLRYQESWLGADLCGVPVVGEDMDVCEGEPDGCVPTLVSPGEPADSVLWLRMGTRELAQMPPFATSVVDDDGVALIEAWIDGLGACP